MPNSNITTIIPTTCEKRRWPQLNRAIDSLRAQRNEGTEILLIVNGDRFDKESFKILCGRRDLRVHYVEIGSVTLAQRIGRDLVTSEFFGFLDDDDAYLDDALVHRLKPMQDDHSVDFVVTNGFRKIGDTDELVIHDPWAIQRDPISAMKKGNWLASCGGLFRSSRVGVEFFDSEITHFEWTFLAYKLLCNHRKLHFVDLPTFCIHDTPGSLSKEAAYELAALRVLKKITDLPLPASARRDIANRITHTNHDLDD